MLNSNWKIKQVRLHRERRDLVQSLKCGGGFDKGEKRQFELVILGAKHSHIFTAVHLGLQIKGFLDAVPL